MKLKLNNYMQHLKKSELLDKSRDEIGKEMLK